LEHPTRELPERDEDAVAAGAVMFRALERAGARLKSKYKTRLVPGAETMPNEKVYRYASITPDMVDDLLVGAWECVEALGIKTSPVTLDRYARHLLSSNEPYSSRHLSAWTEAA
jgi:hypothetical protein